MEAYINDHLQAFDRIAQTAASLSDPAVGLHVRLTAAGRQSIECYEWQLHYLCSAIWLRYLTASGMQFGVWNARW